jgi:hypothetical protein
MRTTLKSLSQTSQTLGTAVSQQESLLLHMYCRSDIPEAHEGLAFAFFAAACRHLTISRSIANAFVRLSCKAVNPCSHIHILYGPIQNDSWIGYAYFDIQGTGPTQPCLSIEHFRCSVGLDVTFACTATAQHTQQHNCLSHKYS